MRLVITFFIFLMIGCTPSQKVLTQKKSAIQSGEVQYNINVVPNNPDYFNADDFGRRAKATFNDKKLHFKKLVEGDNENFQLVDLVTNLETNYLDFRGKKYALESKGEMLPKVGELVFQDEKKNVAGYVCQKATATMADGTLTAWLTQEIGVNFCPYVASKGFALEYTLHMPFGEVTYVASKVDLKAVDEKLFIPSEDYKPVTLEELQADLTGPPAQSAFENGTVLSNFELQNMDGQTLSLESLKGKVVLINFWFINCPPCRMEMPDLNELKADYAGKNVEFVAITFDRKTQVEDFLTKIPFDFQILPNARSIIETYGVQGFPTSVVLNKEGKVVDSKMGGSMNIKEELSAFIDKALAQ